VQDVLSVPEIQPNWTDAQLKAITAPVLVVDGDHDEAIKLEHKEYIASTQTADTRLPSPFTRL
jgi:esterase/lipase